jgi:PAS domain S-box-containing protein
LKVKSISKLLNYTSQSSDEEFFKETFLISCLFFGCFFFFTFSFVNFFFNQPIGSYLMLLGGIIEGILLILFIRHKITFKQVVNAGLFNGWLFMFLDVWFSGGIFASGLPWVILFPFLSFFLIGNVFMTRLWILSSILTIVFFGIMEYLHPLSDFEKSQIIMPLDHTISYVLLVFIMFLLTFIFENKKQEKLILGEKQFRTMFEEAPIGITIFNSENGGINDMNQKYSEIVGRSKKEIRKMGWEKFTHPDDLQKDLDKMAQLELGLITGFKLEKRYIRPNGTVVWVDMVITTFKLKRKERNNYMCMIEDITERKMLEETQLKATQMLKYKSRILANQNEQLNDFCDIVSHNLRAPLASISMLTDYIERTDDEEDRKEMIGKLKPVVGNLNQIFNELVESLQVEQDVEIQREKIDLQEYIDKILLRFDIRIKLIHAQINIHISDAPFLYFPAIYVDSILSNLISNALKYYSSEVEIPIINISTIRVNDTVVLSVSDNGLGIDLERHKNSVFKIRKVFHDHPEAKGFGLYITKKQIEALNGKIWVESTPNVGSTFFLEFPNQLDDK